MTSQDYADFALRFEFLMNKGTNSGLTFHAISGEADPRKRSTPLPEIQLLDETAEQFRQLKPIFRTGSLWSLAVDQAAPVASLGSWNDGEILVKGSSLTVSINGVQTVSTRLTDLSDAASRIPGLLRPKGKIGLQGFDGTTRFRNLRIQELGTAAGAVQR